MVRRSFGCGKPGPGHGRVWTLAATVLAAAMIGGGCGERDGEAASNAASADVQTYEVRGRITALPGEEPGQELMIHHEAIPDFRDSTGAVDPMPAMVMPFPPGSGVSLEGLDVGDKVRATIEVQWEPEAGWTMTAIERLPEDAELELGMAAPEAEREHDDHDHDHDDHDHDHDHGGHDHDDAHHDGDDDEA